MAKTIEFFDSYNDKDGHQFILAFFSDGSITQIALPSGGTTLVAPPNTFDPGQPFPQMVSVGLNGEVVVVIVTTGKGVAPPHNGYFIWDGTNLFQAGTASPVTLILDGGNNYTSVPTVTAAGGSGTGVTLTADVALGSVDQVTVTNPGSGYLATDQAILLFTGGGQGQTAWGTGNIANGVLISISVISGGFGYLEVPSLTITGAGSGATAIVTGVSGGVIQAVQVLTGGTGYSGGVTITDSGQGTGSGTPPPFQSATYIGVVEDGVVVSVTMNNVGSGYSSPPTINYLASSGAGAQGRAELVSGSIGGVAFDFPSQGGSGYQTPPVVQFVGGGGPASGTLQLMPFGVRGNAIESYQSRIWIADGNRISFTAPGSVVDFGDGGGEFQSVDGSLRYKFERLIQSNGFLYVIGDSSVFYISGVNTGPISSSNQTLVTTFSYLNVDPQIGSPWPESVKSFGRRVMMANTQGIYEITGGAVEKVSDPLDNLFYTLKFITDNTLTVYPLENDKTIAWFPSSCVVTLFGKPCYALLIPIIDPRNGKTEVQFLFWDGQPGGETPRGRWWTATQSITNLDFVNGLESNSTLVAYGTDGMEIFPLFTKPSNAIEKVVQSRLWIDPTIVMQKKSWGVYALFECYDETTLDFTTDSELGVFSVSQGSFVGNGSETLPSTVWDKSVAAAPVGITIGFTMTSVSPDFAILDVSLVVQDYVLET